MPNNTNYKTTRNQDGSITFSFPFTGTIESIGFSIGGTQLYGYPHEKGLYGTNSNICTVTMGKIFDKFIVSKKRMGIKSQKVFLWNGAGIVALDNPDGYYEINILTNERKQYGRDYLPSYYGPSEV